MLALCGQKSYQHIEPLDSATVKKAAFIGLVRIYESSGDVAKCYTLMHFKASKPWDDLVKLRTGYGTPDFHKGDVYLIFAEEDEGDKYYIDRNSRIIPEENSEKDITFLVSMLPCVDPKLKNLKQPCRKNFAPVCGCDNKTYGNACEARVNGVLMFSQGECK
jgi:hypothetical protein